MVAQRIGGEFRVNTTLGEEFNPSVAGLASGGFVVTWLDMFISSGGARGSSTGDVGVFDTGFYAFQKASIFGEFGISASEEISFGDDGEQNQAVVTGLSSGDFAVVLTGGEYYVRSGVFDATGEYLGGTSFPTYGNDGMPLAIASLSDGNFVVTWEGYGGESGAQVFDSVGSLAGEPFAVGLPIYEWKGDLWVEHEILSPAVTGIDSGSFVLAWLQTEREVSYETSGYRIVKDISSVRAQIYRANGEKHGEEISVITGPRGIHSDVSIARQSDGGFVISWTDRSGALGDLSGAGITAQRFDAAGAKVGTGLLVNTHIEGDQVQSAVTGLSNGEFVITWMDNGDIGGQVFSSTGAKLGSEFLVNTRTDGIQSTPVISSLMGSRFVIAWEDHVQDYPDEGEEVKVDVMAQIFTLSATDLCPTLNRAGTIDGSSSLSQALIGASYHNTYYFDLAATSGHDTIPNFQTTDVLVTGTPLLDGNGDGLIGFGRDGVLNLEGGAAGDTVAITGVSALRFLGESCEGVYVYASAGVLRSGWIEGTLGDDVLSGGGTDVRAETFLYDTALDVDLGNDVIRNFGARDTLALTSPLRDSDGDNRLGFGTDRVLDLSGGTGAPDDVINPGEVGTIRIYTTEGKQVTSLEFDGITEVAGVAYYNYSLIGDPLVDSIAVM